MVLMMWEIFPLEAVIFSMAAFSSPIAALAPANCCCDSFTRPAALREFSELVWASELISELEAELSSRDAASCDEAWASDWLEAETSPAAGATCSAPASQAPHPRQH